MKRFKKIYVEITNRCNLSCPFCIKNKRSIKDMSLCEIEKVFDEVKNYTDYVYLHVLGEALLHKDILTILDIAYKKNLNVNITTNGTLLGNTYLDLLNKKALRQINVSMHSIITKCDEEKEKYLEDLSRVIKEVDNKKNIFLSLRLWINNNDLNNYVVNKLEGFLGKSINNFSNVFLSCEEEFKWPSISSSEISKKGKCHGGKTHIGILSNGEVVLCCLDSNGDTSFGNIFKASLKDILESEKFKNVTKNMANNVLTEKLCTRCSYHLRFQKKS